MKKRIISMIIVMSLIIGMLPVQVFATDPTNVTSTTETAIEDTYVNAFEDVEDGDWYYDSIKYVVSRDLFSGMSEDTFNPQGNMTRGMYVTVLGRLVGVDPDEFDGKTDFSDVPLGQWYSPYIQWAKEKGIAKGTSDTKFDQNSLVTREQMALMLVNYFDIYEIDYPETSNTTTPKDVETISPWAKDAVIKLWQTGILVGNSEGEFNPKNSASRAEGATLFMNADKVQRNEFVNPEDLLDVVKKGGSSNKYYVTFMDGDTFIDRLSTTKRTPLSKVPSLDKTAKANAIFIGWETEEGEPFYAESPVLGSTTVYAKYEPIEDVTEETLNFTSFAQMDAATDLSFEVVNDGSEITAENAFTLETKDGSPLVPIKYVEFEGVYTVSAENGFNEGCSYQLTLADGYNFKDKADTIRTASFAIAMEEIAKISMNEDIVYIQDPNPEAYLTENGEFTYDGNDIVDGTIVCFYKDIIPTERDYTKDFYIDDPEVYVKVTDVSETTYEFKAVENENSQDLYQLPDNFPFEVDFATELPVTVNIDDVDEITYGIMMGEEIGTKENAKDKLSVGDFVTFYPESEKIASIESLDGYYFGEITEIDDDGNISFEKSSADAIENSIKVYASQEVAGDDILSEEEIAKLESELTTEVVNSDFPMQAASLLADMAMHTDGFANTAGIENIAMTDMQGNAISQDILSRASQSSAPEFSSSSAFALEGDVKVDVKVNTDGNHFDDGVELSVGIGATFAIDLSGGEEVRINLSANFTEELAVGMGVKASAVTKKVLGIPVPVGVKIGSTLDLKNYTAVDMDVEIISANGEVSDITKELNDLMNSTSSEDMKAETKELLDEYSDMIKMETGWITLLDEEMFSIQTCVYGIAVAVTGDFVIRADVNIALGTNLEFEIGKRYSFWFKFGLFSPSSGTDTMDILDERFAFDFYVMGQLGLKAGVRANLRVGIGSVVAANVAVSAEIGPYVKLYGYFIYAYEKYRPANTNDWTYEERMEGALYVDFGMYFICSVSANALGGEISISKDLYDKEIELFTAGEVKSKYGFAFEPEEDEEVRVVDDNPNDTVTMKIPDNYIELSYIDLKNGDMGRVVDDMNQYHFTMSNENFSIDENGVITVDVPEGVGFMNSTLTATWKRDKLSFSNYDVAVEIPLIWTNMPYNDLNTFHTVSVRVGNDEDGYSIPWSMKARHNTPFDLPSEEKILEIIDYEMFDNGSGENMKYGEIKGYEDSEITGLMTIENWDYDFVVEYQDFEITIDDIQTENGSTKSQTFTAKYGESFDFSKLNETGTSVNKNDESSEFTKFLGVQGTYEGEKIDLTQEITGEFAKALSNDEIEAEAKYVDNSILATFTYIGIEKTDTEVRVEKGAEPFFDPGEVTKYDIYTFVMETNPIIAEIYEDTTFEVLCKAMTWELEGDKYKQIHFVDNDGDDDTKFEPITRPTGTLIGTITQKPEKVGSTFNGWYTDEGLTNKFSATNMPNVDITLYGKFTRNTVTVTLNPYGGNFSDGTSSSKSKEIDYGTNINLGDYYVSQSGKSFAGWYTSSTGGSKVTSDTDITYDMTLYARWVELKNIPENQFTGLTVDGGTYGDYETKTKDFHWGEGNTIEESELVGYLSSYHFAFVHSETNVEHDDEVYNLPAGSYNVKVTRNADDSYNKFEELYENVFDVARGERKVPYTNNGTEYWVDYSEDGNKAYIYVMMNYLHIQDLHEDAKFKITLRDKNKIEIETKTSEKGELPFGDEFDERVRFEVGAGTAYYYLDYLIITDDPNYIDTHCINLLNGELKKVTVTGNY